MAENPTVEGEVKSLRHVAPGGDLPAFVFLGMGLLQAASLVASRPIRVLELAIGGALLLVFLLSAYVVYASARDSGIFITDSEVTVRVLGQVRSAWKRGEVTAIEPSGRGVRIVGLEGRTLREIRYRWWSTLQVEKLARSTGLASTPGRGSLTPGGASEADPGKPGDG